MSDEPAHSSSPDGGEPNSPQTLRGTNSDVPVVANNQIVDSPRSPRMQDDTAISPIPDPLNQSCFLVPSTESDQIDKVSEDQQNRADITDNLIEVVKKSNDSADQQTEAPAAEAIADDEIGSQETHLVTPNHDTDGQEDTMISENSSRDGNKRSVTIDLTLADSDDDEDLALTLPSAHKSVLTPRIKQEPQDGFQHQTVSQQIEKSASFDAPASYHNLPDLGSTNVPGDDNHVTMDDHTQDFLTDITADQMRDMLQEFNRNSMGVSVPPIEEFDSDDEEAKRQKEFQVLKTKYENKKRSPKFTWADQIEFERAATQEQMRTRARRSRKQQENDELTKSRQEDSLFIPEDQDSPLDNHSDDDTALPPDNGTEVEAPLKKKPRGRPRGKSNVGSILGKVDKSSVSKQPPKSKRGRKAKQPAQINVSSLLHHDIIAEANANQNKESQTVFTAKNRKDALSQLISSIPLEDRNLYVSDKTALDKAIKNFNGSRTLKSDQHGGWLLKGMNSSLKSYQVLGVSWMRTRENQTSNPRGGILSDDMGLGKTVSALANMVDGRPSSDHRGATATLVIVPPGLMSQWISEVEKHVNIFKNVMIYRSKMKIMNMADIIGKCDVVITSYHEVLRSLPPNNPPPNIFTPQAKAEWYAKEIEFKKGPLHQVFWYRIVLDEAQAIKNHLSRTSEAICFLRGRYRWCLSGTPVQNSLEEFYPYFRFLKCDHTGNFDLFKRNFAKRGSELALQRLQVYLSKIMLRRTHVDQFLGKPILKLPPIKPVETKVVKFNAVEHAIYRIVKNRFVQRVNTLSKKDSPGDNYQQILVLLLRLRQLVGHPLLIQKTLKDLLETEDLERLWALTGAGAISQPNEDFTSDGNEQTTRALTNALELSQGAYASANPSGLTRATDNQLSFNFRRYLEALHADGKWAEANLRSICCACGNPPTDPYITSCLHLYCHTCLNDLRYSHLLENKDKATCSECSATIEISQGYAAKAYDEAGRRSNGRLTPEEEIDWYSIGGPILRSAKVKAAVEQINKWFEQDPANKILVFTQFRGMIKIMERVCREEDWGYASYHGAMSFDSRDEQVRKFSTDPECKILLAALKAGGVGLNLTAANRVIIFDLWWNSSVESQAFTRCFRIGQERDVEVVRLVVHDSVDIDIQRMQERKIAEIEQAMEDRHRPNLTVPELLDLFSDGSDTKRTSQLNQSSMLNGEDEPFIFPDDPYDEHNKVDEDEDTVMLD